MTDHTQEQPRVVVLTGASSGIGRLTASAFARSGASLVLASRDADALSSVERECRSSGASTLTVPTDVSRVDEVERLATKTIEAFGHFDVWINNAGVAALGRFDEIPLPDHTQVIATDLLGAIYGSAMALKQFRAQGRGTLINVASALGEIPTPYYASYVAAKHGIVGLGTSLRQELSENGEDAINVCTVLPMAMETPFFAHAANYTGHEAVPIPPVYDPQLVADAIVELVESPQAEVVVGGAGKVATAFHALAAGLIEKLLGAETHKVQMEAAPPAPVTTGNLYAPAIPGQG